MIMITYWNSCYLHCGDRLPVCMHTHTCTCDMCHVPLICVDCNHAMYICACVHVTHLDSVLAIAMYNVHMCMYVKVCACYGVAGL